MKKTLLLFSLLGCLLAGGAAMAQSITSFSPLSAKPGDAVTITGTGFNTTAANNIVFFGATRATVTAATATSITATVPTGATYAPISVLNTATVKIASSRVNFHPVYTPTKTGITADDFLAKIDFTTGTTPYSIAIGDLDGDGKPDLAVTNTASNTVSVFRNTGSSGSITAGSFATKVDFTTGTDPSSVAIGDLNGDGKPDLAVTNFVSNTVSVFRNTSSAIGSISFAAKIDFLTGVNPHSVAIGDVDGDGKPELAVANYSSNISVLPNTGTISSLSFGDQRNFDAGNQSLSIAIGDLNGDGKPELAVANGSSNTVSVLQNTSASGFFTFYPKIDFTTGSRPFSVAIGDLNGDGKPELATANRNSSTVSVFRNNGTSSSSGNITVGSFADKIDFTTGDNPSSVAIGDVDGDGKPDLAAANNGTGAYSASVFRNTGTAAGTISFATKIDVTTGTEPRSIAIGDLDGDGKPDLVTANYSSNSVSVLRNADIVLPTISSFSPLSAKPGDAVTITGTGFNTTPANNIVFFGATRATVTAATATSITATVPTGATYAPITVLNTTLVRMASSRANFNPIYAPAKTNITTTDFWANINFTTGNNPRSVAIGDLDGDGKPDLVTANSSGTGANSVSVLRNTGSSGSMDAGSFAAKVDLTTGTNPSSVAIGDVDGDGKPDLVVANSGLSANSVSVFRNTGTAAGSISFAAKIDFATGTYPNSVAIGDLDGDGKPDLAIANNSSNTVSVLRNTGTAAGTVSFAAKIDFTTGTSPWSVAIGDLDGDGKPDLAVANASANNVSVLRNTGTTGSITTSSFAAKIDLTTAANPYSVALGDLDGDGKPELVTANGGTGANSVSVLRNTGTAAGSVSFAAKTDFITGTTPISVAIGDVDGDGKPDLVTANLGSDNLSVLRNTGSSGTVNFAAKTDFSTGAGPWSVAIGDVDGDGKPDLAVANAGANSVSVLRNADDIVVPIISSFSPLSAKPGDAVTITGTGFNTTPANNIVFFGATRATLTAATATSITATVPTGATYAPITVLNTATARMASSMANFHPIYAPVKTGITPTDFAAKTDFTTGAGPWPVAIGDLDGDGKSDLVVPNSSLLNSISVLRNTGSSGSIEAGSFATKIDLTTGDNPISVAIGDVDGDGKLDLVTINRGFGVNSISVLRNTSTAGSISFAAKIDFTTGTSPWSVAIGDFDGDGKPDLVVANAGANTVSVFRNTGTAGSISFTAKTDFATGEGPTLVAIGDLDGDGKPDLAVANGNSNSVSVLRNNISGFGNVSFATKVDFTTGTAPYSLAIGDLDGDGKPDLATANYSSNSVSVLRNTGTAGSIATGSFAAKIDFATGAGPRSVAIGDLDGDGRPDLAMANYNVNTVSVLRNTGTAGSITTSSFAAKTDLTVGTSPISVAIGDLDGDGKPDLATAYYSAMSVLRNSDIVVPPAIMSFIPLSAKPGDAVTITGTGFNTTPANNIVFFGATRATLTAVTATSITATVPTGATYAPITVLNTATVKMASSRANFHPVYAPAKTDITTADFLTKIDFSSSGSSHSVALGDLDGDGKPDLAVGYDNSNRVSVFRNTGNSGSITASSFAAKTDFTLGNYTRSVAIGDLDGDGRPELAVANFNTNTLSVLRNTGSSGSISFATQIDFATGTKPTSVAIGDLDGDGKPDLAVANWNSSSVSVFRNTGTADSIGTISFAAKTDFITATGPYSVAIGDLDGDGKPDLATANLNANNVSVLRNTGTPGGITAISFAAKTDFTTGTRPYTVAIGDLDGDGKPDLATANSGTGANSVSVLRNTGSSGSVSFATKADFTTGVGPWSVTIGDLDGDGRLDLATANSGTNSVSVLRSTGSSGSVSFAAKTDFTTGNFPSSVAIGDLDGDGKPDLVTGNFGPNTVSVLRNADISGPMITTTGTLTAFTACAGAASAQQSFTVSGSNLTANITVTAPTGFEVSTTSGSGFASSLTLTQSGGNIATATVFVRMAATATGTPSGNVAVASTGAATNVLVSGTVNALPTASIAVINNVGNSIIDVTGDGSTYFWSNGATAQDIAVVASDTYSVTVTGLNGCTITQSVSVTVTPVTAQTGDWFRQSTSAISTNSSLGRSIAIDASGNTYVVGSFSGSVAFGNTTLVSGGDVDIFLAKYDATGVFQWARRAGGTATDQASGVAVSGTAVYVTGAFRTTANFNTPSATGSNEITSAGNADIFLAKYDETGTFQWARRAGSNINFEQSYGVAVSGTAVYLTGVFAGTANFNTPSATGSNEITSAGGNDIFLAKYDASGAFQWAKRAGGTSDDQGNGVAVSGTSVYLTGTFNGTANFNSPSAAGTNEITSAGGSDIFLAQYNDTGAFQWAKRAGETSNDEGRGVAVSGTTVYLTGSFQGTANFNSPSATGTNEIVSAGGIDIFLAQYNDTGAFQWAKRAGGTGNDIGYGIAVSGTSVFITGDFGGTANFNNPSATGSNQIISAGFNDIFLARYDAMGSFLWAKRAGGTAVDRGFGVAASATAVYMTGLFIATANFNTPSATGSNELRTLAGNGEAFLAKYVLTAAATLTLGTGTNSTNCNGNGSIAFTSTGITAGTQTLSYTKNTVATTATVTVAANGTFTLTGLGAGVYDNFAIGTTTATGNRTLTATPALSENATTNITTGTVVVAAQQSITATNRVSTANVTYRAGSSVTLSPGFQATGNTFQATIGSGGCN